MNPHSDEAVVLQQMPYQDRGQIVTYFTRESGIVKGVVKGTKKGNPISPLCWIDLLYVPGRTSSLVSVREMKVREAFLPLRQELKKLEAGCELLKAVLLSQEEHHPAPELYQLLLYFLQRLPQVEEPRTLVTAMRLKILRHEGLIPHEFFCDHCRKPLGEALYWAEGLYCALHAPPTAVAFSQAEGAWIQELTFGRSFAHLLHFRGSSSFFEKVRNGFLGHY